MDHKAKTVKARMVLVDRGALTMALNVLRRAGKDEVADELAKSVATPEEIRNQKPGNKFELTLRGFDGGTDETDDRIIAVVTPMMEGALREFLDYMAHDVVSISALPESYDAIDFQLPEDVTALRARVKAVLSA